MAEEFLVVFAVYPNVTQLDLTGPHEVLARLPDARCILASSAGGDIEASGGLVLTRVRRLAEIEHCALICVPGGFGSTEALEDQELLTQLRRLAQTARYVTSVCTGSLLLGGAGLLKGKRAASHWASRDALSAFGATPDSARVVRDGNVFTGGGVTAGIDMALTVMAEVAGDDYAQSVQLGLEYAPAPPFNTGRPDLAPQHILSATQQRYERVRGARDAAVQRAAARLSTCCTGAADVAGSEIHVVRHASINESDRQPDISGASIKGGTTTRFPPFQLVNWFAAAEGRFDLSLSSSDCEPLCLSDLFDKRELPSFANCGLGYGTFAGLEQLRGLVARQYATIDKNDVLIFGGASEAIYTFMRTMLNPGDEVVVQNPMFHSLHAIARSIGCKITEWRPTDETTCEFDIASLIESCSPRTKLIVFNFPHNPTGQLISESDLRRIVETARRCNAFVFSDEQFRLLEMPSVAALPAACDLYDKAVSVTGVSKTYGCGGLRIGWLATRCAEVITATKEYRFYSTETVNTPSQILACRVLERGGEILARNRNLITANVERLRAFVDQHRNLLVFHPPKAGTLTMVEQKTSLTSTGLCERLLDEQRVFLVPGKTMEMSDRLLRFGLGRNDFAAGLHRLGNLLQGQRPR